MRLDRASEEAVSGKRCIGSLRYLWRNSPNKAHHASVQEMKSYLVESPMQRARSRGSLENGGDAEDAPPPLEDQGAEPHRDEGAAAEDEDAMSERDVSDDNEQLDESSGGEPSEGESLRAPTAVLGHEPMRRTWDPWAGESPLPDSDGELPDSQRPGAWIGKFYKNHRTMGDNPEDADFICTTPIDSDSPDGDDGPDGPDGGDSDGGDKGQHDGVNLSQDSCDLCLGEDDLPHVDDWIAEIAGKLGLGG